MGTKRERGLVPPYIEDLKAYSPGKSEEEIRRLYDPPRITKLVSNENRWGHSEEVEQLLSGQLAEGYNYPDAGATALREKLADIYDLKLDNIVLGNGSESLLSIIAKTFFWNDEKAVTARGTFVGFFIQARIRGIQIERVPLTSDYRFDVKSLLEAVDEQTKMIYIANPNNPTGTYITVDEFEYLMESLPDHVLVVMDEAYFEFARDRSDYPDSMDYRLDNVITLRTFSKAYGLAGFRIGYALGESTLINYMYKTKLVFEPSMPAQWAASAALADQSFLEQTIERTAKARERLYGILDRHDITYIRSQSNSVMMLRNSGELAAEFADQMMRQGVILRRLSGFGIPRGIRITVGTEEDMDHLEEALDQVLTDG